MDWKPFFRNKFTKDQKQFINFSRKCELLRILTPHELMLVYPHIHIRKYKKNEVLFFTGDSSMALYLIMKGDISLNIEHKNRLEKFLSLSGADTVGESSVLYDHPRPYTAIVESEDVIIGVIPSLALKDILNHHIKMKVKVYEYLAKRYTKYTHLLVKIYKDSIFFDMSRLSNFLTDDTNVDDIAS